MENQHDPTAPTAPPPPYTSGTLKGTRGDVLRKVGESGLTDIQKGLLSAEIQAMKPEIELIKLDFHRQDFRGGCNCTFTITEL